MIIPMAREVTPSELNETYAFLANDLPDFDILLVAGMQGSTVIAPPRATAQGATIVRAQPNPGLFRVGEPGA